MRTRIKMCGMTRACDIAEAISLGVDAIGFIFYANSPRCLSLSSASSLLQGLPAFVEAVAVFVNPEVSFVSQVLAELPIGCLQFHGEETQAFCQQFARPYIKAVPALSTAFIGCKVDEYVTAAALLLDTPSVRRGGTGEPFDWALVPSSASRPIILAGGLDVSNVGAAIKACTPYAVDVCSGIESSPGVKDHAIMKQFVNRVRGCDE